MIITVIVTISFVIFSMEIMEYVYICGLNEFIFAKNQLGKQEKIEFKFSDS